MSVQQRPGTIARHLTADEFWELPETDDTRSELVEAYVVETPPAGPRHNEIAFNLAVLIFQFARQHRLGWASGDSTGYVIPGERDSVLIPDASFISSARLPPGETPDTGWPFPPDLAVEVVSPNDRANDISARVTTYLQAGTQLVWVVWPRTRTIYVFRPGGADTLNVDDRLDGGDVLPGFSVPVAEIFAAGESHEELEGQE